jgi:hypothetical protein
MREKIVGAFKTAMPRHNRSAALERVSLTCSGSIKTSAKLRFCCAAAYKTSE